MQTRRASTRRSRGEPGSGFYVEIPASQLTTTLPPLDPAAPAAPEAPTSSLSPPASSKSPVVPANISAPISRVYVEIPPYDPTAVEAASVTPLETAEVLPCPTPHPAPAAADDKHTSPVQQPSRRSSRRVANPKPSPRESSEQDLSPRRQSVATEPPKPSRRPSSRKRQKEKEIPAGPSSGSSPKPPSSPARPAQQPEAEVRDTSPPHPSQAGRLPPPPPGAARTLVRIPHQRMKSLGFIPLRSTAKERSYQCPQTEACPECVSLERDCRVAALRLGERPAHLWRRQCLDCEEDSLLCSASKWRYADGDKLVRIWDDTKVRRVRALSDPAPPGAGPNGGAGADKPGLDERALQPRTRVLSSSTREQSKGESVSKTGEKLTPYASIAVHSNPHLAHWLNTTRPLLADLAARGETGAGPTPMHSALGHGLDSAAAGSGSLLDAMFRRPDVDDEDAIAMAVRKAEKRARVEGPSSGPREWGGPFRDT